MKQNRIVLETPVVHGGRIECGYKVSGPWSEAFKPRRRFAVDYGMDTSDVPASVAVIPLLANLLPVSWVYDAEVVAPCCDRDFYESVPLFKRGYEEMYPMIDFGGTFRAERVEENPGEVEGAICLFSGGVDAFATLIEHAGENPLLMVLRGADVSLEDDTGWRNVQDHVREVSQEFGTEFLTVSSDLKEFLNEAVLEKKVAASGDNWWHGFQHGVGLICHAAPIAYVLHKEVVYIASSFTAADKGKVTCASDPSIDNNVRFCGTRVWHDGYQYRRQDKVHNIVEFARKTGMTVRLRVCWESEGGTNCCRCEKCFRTLLAIYAEKGNPREFGFEYGNLDELGRFYRRRFSGLGSDAGLLLRYLPIQEAMRRNLSAEEVADGLRWFYEGDLSRLVHASIPKRALRKVIRTVKRVLF